MPATNAVPPRPMRRRLARVLLVLVLAIGAAGAYVAVGFWRLFGWLDEGVHRLAPLEVALIEAGTPAAGLEAAIADVSQNGDGWPSLDTMILATQTIDRRVRHLSRGAPRHDPLWRTWYVKVFMETELVTEAGLTRSISFALRYRMDGKKFVLLGTETLGI